MIRVLAALVVVACCGTARAQTPSLSYSSAPVKMSREDCTRTVVAALAADKFPYAEATPDGHARGWNDKSAVLVLVFATTDPELYQTLTIVCSLDGPEADRLRAVVKEQFAKGPAAANSPKRVAPANGKVPPAPISMCWKSEERSTTALVKHFPAVAALVLEKYGLKTKSDNPMIVFGSGPTGVVTTFLAPSPSALAMGFNTVSIVPGDKPAEKLAEDVLSKIVKILYE